MGADSISYCLVTPGISEVEKAALYGPEVLKSEDWRRFERGGEVTHVQFVHEFEGENQRVGISVDGTITVFISLDEQDSLALLQDVDRLVTPFLVAPQEPPGRTPTG